ncbi:MAG: hypothetical protein ACTSVY_01175 [Candidatus Helarchaeota archaeon]
MDSEDIYVLKAEIKRKMKQLEEKSVELEKFKSNFGKKLTKIMQDKMNLNLDLENCQREKEQLKSRLNEGVVPSEEALQLKAQLENKEKLLKENIEKVKKLNEIITQKDSTIKKIQDQTKQTIHLKDETIKEKDMMISDLQAEVKIANSQVSILKDRIQELQDKIEKSTHDEKGNTIIKLIKQLEENEKVTYELKKEHDEMEEKLREVLAARSDIDKIMKDAAERENKLKEELLAEKEKLRLELEESIEKRNAIIQRMESELKLYRQELPEGVIFGEEQSMKTIKEILKNTKRNAVIFLPKFELARRYDLDLKQIPPKIQVRLATNVNDPQDLYIDELRDYPHIMVKKYEKSDLMAILSDNVDLFIAFIKKGAAPSGIKTTNDAAIEFIGSLLLRNFSQSRDFF